MNRMDLRYTAYSLTAEMLATPGVIENFDLAQATEAEGAIAAKKRAFLTGEGSSRTFPAKHFVCQTMLQGIDVHAATDGSLQAAEYDLSGFAVFAASNSGRTKEVVTLFKGLKEKGHDALFSLSAYAETPLGGQSTKAYVLSCGKEEATAATKSLIEQALFYHSILDRLSGKSELPALITSFAEKAEEALTMEIDPALVEKLANANVIYWAGRNTGVAEELTLKTNEIPRKKSAYLEGTITIHGVQEVMNPDDALIWVEPWEMEEAKFEDELVKGVGCTVVALSTRETSFPTIKVPSLAGLDCYLRMLTGWNLLVEMGCALQVNLDVTERAQKVAEEFD